MYPETPWEKLRKHIENRKNRSKRKAEYLDIFCQMLQKCSPHNFSMSNSNKTLTQVPTQIDSKETGLQSKLIKCV